MPFTRRLSRVILLPSYTWHTLPLAPSNTHRCSGKLVGVQESHLQPVIAARSRTTNVNKTLIVFSEKHSFVSLSVMLKSTVVALRCYLTHKWCCEGQTCDF